MTTRWIVHRQLGVGEVLDGEGRQVTARFRSGVQVVNGKFRPVAADSLVVMFHRAPDEARALVRDDPLAVARALLGEMQSPATGDQLVSQARASGLTTDEADRWWAATHSLVDADPTIASQGDPPRYSLTAPDPVPSTEQEKDAKDSREGADPDGISLKSIEQSEDDDHLADLAFGSSSPEFARAAGRRLAERLSQGALGAVLEERIAPLVSALRADPEDAAPIVRDLDVVLRRAKPLVARGCPTAGLRMLLAADAVLGALAKDVVGRAPTALAQLLQAAAPDAAAFEQAIAPLSDAELSGRLARLPLVPKGARLALLDAMAVAGRRTPLLDQATWAGTNAAALGQAVRSPAVVALLDVPAGQALAAALVRPVLTPLKAEGLATLVASPPLIALFDDAELRPALEGLARADKQIGRLRDLLAEPLIDAVQAGAREAGAEAGRRIVEAEERVAAAIRDAEQQIENAARAELHARGLLKDAVAGATAPYESELRQARIDAYRDAASVLADVSRMATDSARSDLEAAAARRGLLAIGSVGAEVPFDRASHEALDGNVAGQVIIVESGWQMRIDGTDVVLAKAVVRSTR